MSQRRAGILFIKVDGAIFDAKGNFTYNLGKPKREAIVGADAVHGFKEMPQVAFVEGEFTDSSELDVVKLLAISGATVTLELANGKVCVFREAWFAGEGNVQTEEGNIAVRFEAKSAEEVA